MRLGNCSSERSFTDKPFRSIDSCPFIVLVAVTEQLQCSSEKGDSVELFCCIDSRMCVPLSCNIPTDCGTILVNECT